jgi:hypothetical protein
MTKQAETEKNQAIANSPLPLQDKQVKPPNQVWVV